MITSIKERLIYLIRTEVSQNIWEKDDLFYEMKLLSIDQRGRVGEHFLRDVFQELNMNVEYINNAHGDFDLIVNNKRIEIKTATLDTNQKFQHEGIKDSDKWDAVAFLDIAPNQIYLTIIPKVSFRFNVSYINKNGVESKKGELNFLNISQNIHFRGKDGTNNRATGAGYKVDLKCSDLIPANTIKDIENIFYKVFPESTH
ncbi:hypothetical protein H9M94_03550 [Mycoplasma sp. Pen4]|uniref:hypothetical protein n=1 Tax=Mycoplasma sp. Pen4 TaxID=640330 RepID=UPI0016545347|nr:hypothetical protein [Mycoplasma sp. Pen4]QNM93642.1 hypothetical protein H9M94_03550 [Mycoplasma sp. Pen4]